jgi:uncharacterized protein
VNSDHFIVLQDGSGFDPFYPNPLRIHPNEVANALANLCRFGGRLSEFYSVAQHCSLIAGKLWDETNDPTIALWGLLHDASEAYLNDLARPIKHAPGFEQYRQMEDELMQAVAVRFALPWPMPAEVKVADNRMVLSERERFKLYGGEPVATCWPTDVEPYSITISPATPVTARRMFLDALDYLMPLHAGRVAA